MSMNTTSNTNNHESTSIACFLDLPSGSALSIDGTSVSIQRDDFVGLSQLPHHFHLITIAATTQASSVGFVLNNNNETLVRRYDPRTEEVSSTIVVDDMTIQHLLQQVPALEQQQRIVPYHLLVNTQQQEKWNHLTNYISKSLLQQRGIHMSGQKVVPGCLDDDNNNNNKQTLDGTPLSYVPVPILDQQRPRWSSHIGTQRFLQTLSAQEKTQLFIVDPSHPSQRAWDMLFSTQYQNDWTRLLGDVQLSFLFFIHLHCFESLVHWRDLLSLLGQLKTPSRLLIPVLVHQLSSLDASDLLPEDDEEENSIAVALDRLVQIWRQESTAEDDDSSSLQQLSYLIQDRLGTKIQAADDDDDDDDEEDVNAYTILNPNNKDDDSDNSPMVVDMDEYEAALRRNQQTSRLSLHSIQYAPAIAQTYPILWAAKQDHEDLVMTCARALEEAKDVSLVRQAADYLQQVEAKAVEE